MVQIVPHYAEPDAEGTPPPIDRLENKTDFVLAQDQAFWLLYVEAMEWDVDDDVAAAIVDRPDADLAVIAVIFWRTDPAYALRRPETLDRGLTGRILRNLEAGHYADQMLALPRHVLAPHVLPFIRAAKALAKERPLPFQIPRRLFGPFEGAEATLPKPTDPTSMGLLAEWTAQTGGLDMAAAARRHYWTDPAENLVTYDFPEIDEPWHHRHAKAGMVAYAQALYGDPDGYAEAAAREAAPDEPPPDSPWRIAAIVGGIMAVLALAALGLLALR
ncbi:MAG: DUF4274 domain-containing protein [Shimia sp.]